jgi:hypothetical protein
VACVPALIARPVVLPAELIHLITRERVTLLLIPRSGEDPADGAQYRVGARIGLQRHHQEPARAWVHILDRAHASERAAYEAECARRRSLPLDEQLRLALRDCAARGVADSGPRHAIAKQIAKLEERALAPADRTRDAEVRPPEDDDLPRRRRRRANPEAAARRRHERERKKPGPLGIHRVDPADVAPGQPVPRVESL